MWLMFQFFSFFVLQYSLIALRLSLVVSFHNLLWSSQSSGAFVFLYPCSSSPSSNGILLLCSHVRDIPISHSHLLVGHMFANNNYQLISKETNLVFSTSNILLTCHGVEFKCCLNFCSLKFFIN